LIRAFNVLRQYEEKDFHSPPTKKTRSICSCPAALDDEGHLRSVWAGFGLRNVGTGGLGEWDHGAWEAAWFFQHQLSRPGFGCGGVPKPSCPKNYIHHVSCRGPNRIYDFFFAAWENVPRPETISAKVYGLPPMVLKLSAAGLGANSGYSINLQKRFFEAGVGLIFGFGEK